MKQRPIIFNTDMVRAILDGRKTQTRRPIKTEAPIRITDAGRPLFYDKHGRRTKPKCPFGKTGDQLWVRETHYIPGGYLNIFEIDEIRNGISSPQQLGVIYRADNHSLNPSDGGWKPSIHMSRWASRITLEITNIRVERIQDITETDACAEGVYSNPEANGMWTADGDYHTAKFDGPVRAYSHLWDQLYSDWIENPWVWVIEFKNIEPA